MAVNVLVLDAQTDGTYVYDHSEVWDKVAGVWTTPPYFPLDDRGWALPPSGPEISVRTGVRNRRAAIFTEALRYRHYRVTRRSW